MSVPPPPQQNPPEAARPGERPPDDALFWCILVAALALLAAYGAGYLVSAGSRQTAVENARYQGRQQVYEEARSRGLTKMMPSAEQGERRVWVWIGEPEPTTPR